MLLKKIYTQMITGVSITRFLFSYIFCFLLICFTSCKKDFEERSVAASSDDHASASSGKPNIILFVANDFGFEVPTFNGGQSYSTPNLDFMASNGIHFTQC